MGFWHGWKHGRDCCSFLFEGMLFLWVGEGRFGVRLLVDLVHRDPQLNWQTGKTAVGAADTHGRGGLEG